MMFEWFFLSKELIKNIYVLVILLSCFTIVTKTNALFKLSDHQGLRYFRNAFLFYGLSFAVKFILGETSNPLGNPANNLLFSTGIDYLFGFFTIMAGFFLLYSLIWRYIEKEKNYHSVLNIRVGLMVFASVIIVYIDSISRYNGLMAYLQVVLFSIMLIIGFNNYIKGSKEHLFLKYYFLTMVFGLAVWIFKIFATTNVYVYLANLLFFLSFLFMILKITDKKYG